MTKPKTDRVGEIKKSKQGLTLIIRKYINNKKIMVEVVETGEQKWIRYDMFRKGTFKADLLTYPSRTECSFKTAVFIVSSIALIALGAIGSLIYLSIR